MKVILYVFKINLRKKWGCFVLVIKFLDCFVFLNIYILVFLFVVILCIDFIFYRLIIINLNDGCSMGVSVVCLFIFNYLMKIM